MNWLLLAVLTVPGPSLCDALKVEARIDGKFIVTVADTSFSRATYCVISATGVRALPFSPESWVEGAAWAADGQSVFAVSCIAAERAKDCPVVRADLDGHILQTLPPLPASGFVEPDGRIAPLKLRDPRPAPTADRLAVISDRGLRFMSLQDLATLPIHAENVTDVGWIADGKRVAFLKELRASAPTPSQPNAFLLDVETGAETPLAALGGALDRDWRNDTGHPTFYGLTTAQNAPVVAVGENADGGILLADLGSDEARHIDLDGRCRRDLNLSASARQLAYLACTSRGRWIGMMMDELRVVDLQSGREEAVLRVTDDDVWIADVSWWTEPPVGLPRIDP